MRLLLSFAASTNERIRAKWQILKFAPLPSMLDEDQRHRDLIQGWGERGNVGSKRQHEWAWKLRRMVGDGW
jgi:hypothetical protein